MTDREQINILAKKVSDYADETMKLKQENNALKERIAELESTNKKKRKFRAMTIGEYCTTKGCKNCEYFSSKIFCDYTPTNGISRDRNGNKPFKTKDGKYILIEVKE